MHCTRTFWSVPDYTDDGGPIDYNGAGKFLLPSDTVAVLTQPITHMLCS